MPIDSKIRFQIGKIGNRSADKNALSVYIPKRVYDKMLALTMSASSETSALGMVHLEKDGKPDSVGNEIWVDDLHFINNESTSSSTILDPKGVAQLMEKIIDEQGDEKLLNLRLWFHTHYTFQVFWSSTDHNTAKNTLENGRWTLSIVMNQKQELLARVDIYRPTHKYYNHLPIYLVLDVEKSRWKKHCKDAKGKINTTPIERTIGKENLSKEFIDYVRNSGGIIDKSDVKQVEIEQPHLLLPENQEKKIHVHTCICGFEITTTEEQKSNGIVTCEKCKKRWNVTWKKEDSELLDDKQVEYFFQNAFKSRQTLTSNTSSIDVTYETNLRQHVSITTRALLRCSDWTLRLTARKIPEFSQELGEIDANIIDDLTLFYSIPDNKFIISEQDDSDIVGVFENVDDRMLMNSVRSFLLDCAKLQKKCETPSTELQNQFVSRKLVRISPPINNHSRLMTWEEYRRGNKRKERNEGRSFIGPWDGDSYFDGPYYNRGHNQYVGFAGWSSNENEGNASIDKLNLRLDKNNIVQP